MADDYNQLIEDFFDSIDTIAAARVKDLKFNKTVRCEIVDTTKRDQGEYTVTDGSTKFKAYSDNTKYDRGTYVNVTIPNGDYSAQKMITGRCMTAEEDVFNYVSPLKSYIDITQNLIEENVSSAGLVANGQKSYVTLWEKKDFGGMKAYERLGLKADFKVWLSNLKPVEGNYGLRLSVIGRSMNTTQTESQLKYYTFTLDSNDMYGDPYNFDTFFTQEKVFDISEIPQIESIKLEFYQKQNFKNKKKKYIAHEDEQGYSLGANLFVQNPYISLGYATENYANDTVLIYALEEDTYANYLTAEVKEAEMKKNEEINQKLQDLNLRMQTLETKYKEIVDALNAEYGDKTSSEYKNRLWKIDQEYKEKKDLYQHQYEMLKNELDLNDPERLKEIIEEKNLKNIYLRWIHKDEESGRMVGIQDQNGLPEGAKIHWYRYVLEEGLSDPIAGPFWKELDTSEWESPFLYKAFQPDQKLSSEQLRVIIEYKSKDYVNHYLIPNDEQIILLDEEINKGTATDEQVAERESIANSYLEEVNYYISEILTFKNETEVASETTLSLIKDLVIKCDENGGKGVYNIYNSAGALLSQMEAQKKRILSASYNTLVTGDNTIDLPETVTWRIPLTNTMIYPPTEGVEYSTYSQVSLTKTDDFVIGTHYKLNEATGQYILLQPNDTYHDTDKYFIKNKIDVKTADDGSYIDIIRYGAVTSRVAGTEEADSMEQYFRIKPQYSQNLTNNTVYCIVNKNNKNFEASYTMHFGTTGTNGTDYTFTLEIDNAVPAMTWDPKTGIIVKPKILNHTGKDITDEFSASNFKYSWYSPTQSGDVALTREQDGKNCKIGFKDTTTAIKQTYHHILQCKTTVDITYSTNTMTTSINTSNNSTVEKVTPKTTTKPITLTAYLAIPIRRTEQFTGFAGADKICYSNAGTNPEYYRNQYDLYYYDKNDKKTKVQPNYQKVEENSQEDFNKGIYYEQSFEFTQVDINSQAELKPGVHYKLQNGFKKVTDDMTFDGNTVYYAKTKDNQYIEIDIDSNGELHKGQYYIRKDEYMIASEEEIENNAYATNYFYIKNSDGSYSVMDTIIERIGNYEYIKGRYYTLEGQEYVLITIGEEYDQNTQYYINDYKYVPVATPNEADYINGLYYLVDLGYVLQQGNVDTYNSAKEYSILGTDNNYYPVDSSIMSENIFKNGQYYTLLENGSYSLINNMYYFSLNDQFFIKNNNTYYQVEINSVEELKDTVYYIKDHGYHRVALDDSFNSNIDYYVFGMDGAYHKVEKNIAHIFPEGRYYYEKIDYIVVHNTDPYDSSKDYYVYADGLYINTYFENDEDYNEFLQTGDRLYYQLIYNQEIYNINTHTYDPLNKYFIELDTNTFLQLGVASKEELLLSPYFTYGDFYVETDIYDISNTYYLEILDNGEKKYIETIVASENDMSVRQYYYRNENNNYIEINQIFDKNGEYYARDKSNSYIQLNLSEITSLEYGNYYTIDNIYYATDPDGDDFNSSRQYYLRQLGDYVLKIDLGSGSQTYLNEILSNNDNCFKLQVNYKLLQNNNEYNENQTTYYRQRVNGRYDPMTISSVNDLNIISNFYIIKNQYRLITEKDVFKFSARYFTYDITTQQYIEVTGQIQKTSDFQIGIHYILEDGYFAVETTDTYSSTQTYYIKDNENNYYEVILSSNNELQKGVYYITDNKKVLVTSEDVYDEKIQYYLPGNITYEKAETYKASNVYYICTAKWKIRLGANTGYNYNKAASDSTNAKIAKCYPMMSEDNTLVPLAMYVQETKPEVSVVCINESNNHVLWVQPIRIYLNAHSSQLLNAWSGELTIDENNGTILSSLVGAGKKDSENRFNGILMGDMTKASDNETATEYYTGTGLYGYNAGIKSFGLNINGRAFFGKAGRGQILIDGNSGKIKSARYAATEKQSYWKDREGMLINLDTGLIRCHAINSKATISIDPNNTDDGGELGYFRINSAKGNKLMHIGDDAYYLRTDDYQVRESEENTTTGKTKITTPGKGLNFNLKDGRLIGYNFAITAYADEAAGTYDTADIKYISINSKASTYPLKIGDKFKVSWNGKITSTGGTIGGWIIQDTRLYKNYGDYTISLRKAEKSDTKVIQVWEQLTKDKGQNNFYVLANGKMYARKADISGKITADSGKIGGWTIGETYLKSASGNTVLYSNGKVKLRGTTVSISSRTVVTGLTFKRGGSSKSVTVVTDITTGPLGGYKSCTKKKLTFYYPRLEVQRAKLTVIGYASASTLTPDGANIYSW